MKLEKYSIVKDIYPPLFSVIRLIGDRGYEHLKSFRTKKQATAYITNREEFIKEVNRITETQGEAPTK